MNFTGCADSAHFNDITTTGYAKQSDRTISKVLYDYETFAKGNSNLYSNLKDLIIWDELIRSKKLLSDDGYSKWFTGYARVLEQSEYEDKGDQLGYGWFLTFKNNNELFKTYHLGGVTGYKAAITRFPKEEILIVTLSNVEDQYPDKIRLEFPKLVYKTEKKKQ
jgi:CubicO group peptidase (beta-lactamase class C family)